MRRCTKYPSCRVPTRAFVTTSRPLARCAKRLDRLQRRHGFLRPAPRLGRNPGPTPFRAGRPAHGSWPASGLTHLGRALRPYLRAAPGAVADPAPSADPGPGREPGSAGPTGALRSHGVGVGAGRSPVYGPASGRPGGNPVVGLAARQRSRGSCGHAPGDPPGVRLVGQAPVGVRPGRAARVCRGPKPLLVGRPRQPGPGVRPEFSAPPGAAPAGGALARLRDRHRAERGALRGGPGDHRARRPQRTDRGRGTAVRHPFDPSPSEPGIAVTQGGASPMVP